MENLSKIIEGILFVSGEPVSFLDISEKLEVEKEEVEKAIVELQNYKRDNNDGVQVLIFNEKAQLCSNKDYAESISVVLNPIKEKMLTKIVLEVCGIIAYKQPITRLEIENIRGGANCDYAITTLLENNIIEVVGRKDAVGKPLLFGTTDVFLKKFGYEYLIRGHECVSELLKDFGGKCCTVFSSHDYFAGNDARMAIATEKGLEDYLMVKGDGSVVSR